MDKETNTTPRVQEKEKKELTPLSKEISDLIERIYVTLDIWESDLRYFNAGHTTPTRKEVWKKMTSPEVMSAWERALDKFDTKISYLAAQNQHLYAQEQMLSNHIDHNMLMKRNAVLAYQKAKNAHDTIQREQQRRAAAQSITFRLYKDS